MQRALLASISLLPTGVAMLTRIEARLASPLCGEPPHLDSILINAKSMMRDDGYFVRRSTIGPHTKASDLPPVEIPIEHKTCGDHLIALCSSPILPIPHAETVERIERHLDVHLSLLVAPDQRKVVTATDKGWMQRRYRPRRVRRIDCIVWFASVLDRRELVDICDSVSAIGQESARGYGLVTGWKITDADGEPDYAWRWPCLCSDPDGGSDGVALMRPLPLSEKAGNLVGFREHFGAVSPPYWLPDLQMEIITPC